MFQYSLHSPNQRILLLVHVDVVVILYLLTFNTDLDWDSEVLRMLNVLLVVVTCLCHFRALYTMVMLSVFQRTCARNFTLVTARTGWPGCEDCALVMSISTLNEWPLRMMLNWYDPCGEGSVHSVGTGWNKFVEDQMVGDGDLLIFKVVDERCLVVTIHRHRHEQSLDP